MHSLGLLQLKGRQMPLTDTQLFCDMSSSQGNVIVAVAHDQPIFTTCFCMEQSVGSGISGTFSHANPLDPGHSRCTGNAGFVPGTIAGQDSQSLQLLLLSSKDILTYSTLRK